LQKNEVFNDKEMPQFMGKANPGLFSYITGDEKISRKPFVKILGASRIEPSERSAVLHGTVLILFSVFLQ
jgi:hypothetical protein